MQLLDWRRLKRTWNLVNTHTHTHTHTTDDRPWAGVEVHSPPWTINTTGRLETGTCTCWEKRRAKTWTRRMRMGWRRRSGPRTTATWTRSDCWWHEGQWCVNYLWRMYITIHAFISFKRDFQFKVLISRHQMTNNRNFVFVISLIVKFHQAVVIDRVKVQFWNNQ